MKIKKGFILHYDLYGCGGFDDCIVGIYKTLDKAKKELIKTQKRERKRMKQECSNMECDGYSIYDNTKGEVNSNNYREDIFLAYRVKQWIF